jgi:nucleoside 2-deoxyribosyltransferase
MQLIYLGGPLFNEAERAFNATLTADMESLGYKVFLPQRDGAESDRAAYDSMGRQERRLALFSLDRDQILVCDIFLFILDGRVPDEGAAFELGLAYADKYINKKARLLIGLHTDARSTFFQAKLNPMLSVPLDVIFEKVSALIQFLKNNQEPQWGSRQPNGELAAGPGARRG